ncbi:MAG: hypothetical protein ABJP44_19975 [Sulfitobacter sp.]|uniref:hypothetical protein n=3 Tax=Roseobacteraceae TaxID=2854170 RepID=UPI0032973210
MRVKNAGDLLNANIVSAVSKRDTYYVKDKTKPLLFPSGSILGGSSKSTTVWGSGLMHPDMGLGAASSENIHLLRGKKSYEALRASGVDLGDIPLGDPLSLAPKLLGIKRTADVTHKIGVMAHYVDRRSPYIQRILKHPDVIDLNVHRDPVRLMEKMATCSLVLSTCLHGIILSNALDIPSNWIKTDTNFAGDGFEFSDWFSICKEPQITPWKLSRTDKIDDIISECKLHKPDILLEDMEKSFPHGKMTELEEKGLSSPLIPLSECRARAVPVFVISYNRSRMLKKLVKSLEHLSKSTEVVIHDNGSDDYNTLLTLNNLSQQGIKVVQRPKIASAAELNNIDETITAHFENWSEPQNYVVTDCDISVSPCEYNFLEVLDEMLNRFHSVGCIGPMLQIHDISKSNPIYNKILDLHIRQFWGKYPCFEALSDTLVAYQFALIDTTFALHRGGDRFARLKKGIRTYAPYEARHLDWYEEEQEDSYKETSNSSISHWGNQSFIEKVKGAPLPYDHFIRVKRMANQSLIVEKVLINDTSKS